MPIKVLSDDTIRRRDVRLIVPWSEIEELIAKAALGHAGIKGSIGMTGVSCAVDIEQETEGSPSYRVNRWQATVKLTVPLD